MLEATRFTIDWTCSCSRRRPGLQLHEHRGARRAAIAHECGLPRHGQVHARAFDRLQARDRARELGFERVLVARALHELADAEAGILRHQRKAAAAFRQALAGELQARVVELFRRHGDAVRAGLEPIGNPG